MSTCLGCGLTFGSRKQLSAHGARCTDNIALSTMIYERHGKRKTTRSGSRNRQGKKSRLSPARLSSAPDFPEAGPSIPFQDDTLNFADPHSDDHDVSDIMFEYQYLVY